MSLTDTPEILDPPLTDGEAVVARPGSRRMTVVTARESRWTDALWQIIAVALVAGYALFLYSFSAPALGRPGIDENCYLIAGRNIAAHGSPGFKPTDEFQFISAMWIRTPDGWYYPKYPVGLPVMNAIAILVGGREAAFLVSPICMVLAMVGMFYLARAVLGSSFFAVLATIVMASIPTSLEFAHIPNSHPPALWLVVWGMFFLVRFWQTGSPWRGVVSGLLLGAAVTVRYSEALLLFPLYPLDKILADTSLAANHKVLWFLIKLCRLLPIGPIGIVAILSVRWRSRSTYLRAATPVIGWAAVVGSMLIFNWFTMGHLTGYDATNESAGFTTAEFLRKWDFAVQHLYLYGVIFLFPIGIAGLIIMYRGQWRSALLLTMWFVPGTLLYIAYYWGTQSPGVYYLRFFLTLFPPVIIAAFWLFRAAETTTLSPDRRGSIAIPIGAGVLTAATAALGMLYSVPNIARQHRGNLNLAYTARQIETVAGSDRIIAFIDDGLIPVTLQHTSYLFDGEWYPADAYEPRVAGGFGVLGMMQNSADPNAPVLVQQERIEHMKKLRGGMSTTDLQRAQQKLMGEAIGGGKHVYAILTPAQEVGFRRQFIAGSEFDMTQRRKWTEPCEVQVPDRRNRPSNPLSPPFEAGEPLIRWKRQTLVMYEITRHLPPGPATQPR